MKKTIKLMAFAAIAAIGCFAGMQALSSNSESDDSFLFMILNENPDLNPSLLEVKEFK